jgi:hypothetical protein
MTVRRLRTLAGLAAAIVPCAIVVHLVAELTAAGHDALDVGFALRHAYFAALFAGAAAWFGATAGLRAPAADRRRRCALLRADLAGSGRLPNLVALAGANLAFFAVTQTVEGMPVLSGAALLGLSVALIGSLLSALLVFAFGRSLACAGLAAVIGTVPQRRESRSIVRRGRFIAPPRRPSFSYSLFVPTRPPPFAPSV